MHHKSHSRKEQEPCSRGMCQQIRIGIGTLDAKIRTLMRIWFFFDADPDHDFYLMRMLIKIRLFTLMQIRTRILLFCAYPDPTQVAKMMQIWIRNTA
jgi:hypothetical protein